MHKLFTFCHVKDVGLQPMLGIDSSPKEESNVFANFHTSGHYSLRLQLSKGVITSKTMSLTFIGAQMTVCSDMNIPRKQISRL